MPDQEQSTPPAYTEPTFQERHARVELMRAAGKLSAIRSELWNTHVSLDEAPDDDAIAEGAMPETLSFAYRAAIEGVNKDNLEPAIGYLERTALVSVKALREEWEEERRRRAGGA
jgi:hypothetical protein